MGKKWMPITAGVLDILHGAFEILVGTIFIGIGDLVSATPYGDYEIWGPLYIIAGVLAVVGGIYAIKRRKWALALAGVIAASFFPITTIILYSCYRFHLRGSFVLTEYEYIILIPAIFAIVLTVLSRKQFAGK